MLEDEVDD